ncbi:hypothetical protein CHS0354_001644 [Potamilus streckersoni]|uniref:Inositol polyphosphate-related phosphatase domain-containing protein n=1 Tax=Potamilus streckersoni TaxID=2493646 RepID=A0AAE0VZ86_9BIVA|nr:hypothetical protein CHS0354_001644 [Potamilus streckersoni]
MEVETSPNDTVVQSTPKTLTKAKKKKSAVAKLAERKKRSDSGSEFGSTASLQNQNVPENEKLNEIKKSDKSEDLNRTQKTNLDVKDLNKESDDTFSGGSLRAPKRDNPPKAKPRTRNSAKEKIISHEESSKSGENSTKKSFGLESLGVNEGQSDYIPPPLPMDIDLEENESNGGEYISGRIPSDATLHRFRALKMAPEKQDCVESMINSPFTPKPPSTPRSGRRFSKGEKRIRDPNSSGEEADVDSKRQVSEETVQSSKKVASVGNDKVKKESQKVSSQRFLKTDHNRSDVESMETSINGKMHKKEDIASVESAGVKDFLQKLVPESEKNHQKSDIDTLGSASDLKAISDSYQKALQNENTLDLEISASKGIDKYLLDKPPSPGRLAPINPKNPPPPLPHDVKSTSLRTAYKADSTYTPVDLKQFSRTFSGGSFPLSNAETMSHRSFSSGNASHSLLIKEARDRMKPGTIYATLCSEAELVRYFPEKKVSVWVGTWNMAEIKQVTYPIDDFMLPETSEYVQDLYAVGTQENSLNKKEWEILLQETLGPSHVLFHSVTHGALHLAIFIKRDLIWFCSVPEDDIVQTRAVTMVKTKGAIGVGFTFFGNSYLFINCHFAPGDEKKKDRLGDYQKIIRQLNLPKAASNSSPKSPADVTMRYDYVFWMGDMNFRIEIYKGKQAVEDLVTSIQDKQHPNFEDLLSGDQLTKLLVEGAIFTGFQEGRINFKPTYKFDINADTYDTSAKNRIPSYTDRILYRAKKKNSTVCICYDSPASIRCSDHRPVYAVFDTVIQPGKESNLQMAAGHFDRNVYMEANKRRAMKVEVVKKLTEGRDKSSSVCSIQ